MPGGKEMLSIDQARLFTKLWTKVREQCVSQATSRIDVGGLFVVAIVVRETKGNTSVLNAART